MGHRVTALCQWQKILPSQLVQVWLGVPDLRGGQHLLIFPLVSQNMQPL